MPSQLSYLVSAFAAVLLLTEGKSIGNLSESGDLSGDETEANIENPVLDTASALQQEVAKLKAEFNAKYPDVEDTNEINSTSDGCLLRNFSKTKCLRRITTGLAQYAGQMQYVGKEFQSTLCDGIMYRISQLQKLVEDMQRHKPGAADSYGEVPLSSGSPWERKAAVKGFLRSFDQFLIDAHRALRYMHRKKSGEKRHQLGLPHEITPLD